MNVDFNNINSSVDGSDDNNRNNRNNIWKVERTTCLKWPKVHMGQILRYISENKAFSSDYIGQYKVRKAFSFFKVGLFIRSM